VKVVQYKVTRSSHTSRASTPYLVWLL